jgi:integrase
LVAGARKQKALFLQILKETDARRGEAYNLKWTDIDLTQGTIRITPEKDGNPRQFKISTKLAAMLASTQQQSGRVWKYASIVNLEKTFRRQRKRTAHKLQNLRLRIHFHTLRALESNHRIRQNKRHPLRSKAPRPQKPKNHPPLHPRHRLATERRIYLQGSQNS